MADNDRSVLDVLCGSSPRKRLSKVYQHDVKAAAADILRGLGDADVVPAVKYYVRNLSVWRYSGATTQHRAFIGVRDLLLLYAQRPPVPRLAVIPPAVPVDWNSPYKKGMLGLHSTEQDQELVASLPSTLQDSQRLSGTLSTTLDSQPVERRVRFPENPVTSVRFFELEEGQELRIPVRRQDGQPQGTGRGLRFKGPPSPPPPVPPPPAQVEMAVRAATRVAADEAGIEHIQGRCASDVLEEAAANGSQAAQTALDWHSSIYNGSAELHVSARVQLQSGARPRLRRVLPRGGRGAGRIPVASVRQQVAGTLIREEAGFRYPKDPIVDITDVSVVPGVHKVELDEVLMRGITLHSRTWRALLGSVYNLRDGSCVLDYIIHAAADAYPSNPGDVNNLTRRAKLDDVSIREQFAQVCDVEAGISVKDIDAWIRRFNHPIGYYALDPLTMEVFAQHREAPRELALTFVVAHGHLYPITDKRARSSIFHHHKLLPHHFGMIVTDTDNFTYLPSSDPTSEAAIVDGTPPQEVLFTDIPLEGLMYSIADKYMQAPDQLETRYSRVTAFVHPVNLKVVRFAEEWEERKRVCQALWDKYRCIEFSWRGQGWASIGCALAAIHVGQIPKSMHRNVELVDRLGAVQLVQRIHDVEDGIAIDCRRCYTRAMNTNTEPWPMFTELDDFHAWDGQWHTAGEYYIVESPLQRELTGVVLPAQALSRALAEWLVTNGYLPRDSITHYRAPRTVHPAGMFTTFISELQKLEAEVGGNVAKPLLNQYAGCLNIRNDRKHMSLMCIDYEEALCHFIRQRDEGNHVSMVTAEMPHANMVIVQARKDTRRGEDYVPLWNQIISNATLMVLQKAVQLVRDSGARLVGFKTDCILVDCVGDEGIVLDEQWKREEFRLPISSWVPNRKLWELEPIPDWVEVTKEELSLEESCFITGPGGSGKTWLCTHLIAEYAGLSALCVATTNTATDRLRQLLEEHGVEDVECSTIDSALGRQKHGGFKLSSFDVLLVDEVSMVSVHNLRQLMLHGPRVCIVLGDFNQIPPVEPGRYSYDYSHTARFREWCGLRICRLAYNPEYGRYDQQAQLMLEYFLANNRLPPCMRHLRVDPSLRRNIAYHNDTVEGIVARLTYPRQAGDWVWTQGGEVEQLPVAEPFSYAQFQPGRLVLSKYSSRDHPKRDAFKSARFFNATFYTVEAVVPGGYRLVGVDGLVVPDEVLRSGDACTAHKYQGNEVDEPFNIWELDCPRMSKEIMYTALSRTTKFEYIHLDYTDRVFTSSKQLFVVVAPAVSPGQHMWRVDDSFKLLVEGPDKVAAVQQKHPGAEHMHKTYCQTEVSCQRTLALQKGEAHVRVKKLVQPFAKERSLRAYTIQVNKRVVFVTVGKQTIREPVLNGDRTGALARLKARMLPVVEARYGSLGDWEYEYKPGNQGHLALVLKSRHIDAPPEPEVVVPESEPRRIDRADYLKERKTLEDFCDPQLWYDKKAIPWKQAVSKGTLVVKYGAFHFRECRRDELVHMIHRSIHNGKGQLYEDMHRNVRLCADLDMEVDPFRQQRGDYDECGVALQVVDVANEVALRKGVHLGRGDWQYQNATRPGKLSFHVICGREVFEILSDQKSFWQDVVALIGEKHPELCWEKMCRRSNGKETPEPRCIVDLAIYKSAQPMRCLYSEKAKKNNFLKPMVWDGERLVEVLAPAVDLQYISKNLCTAPPPAVYSSLAVSDRRNNVPRKRRGPVSAPATPLRAETRALLAAVRVPQGFDLDHAEETGGTVRLNRVRPSHCRCCDRVHHSDNAYLYQRAGVWYFRCFKEGAQPYAVSDAPKPVPQQVPKPIPQPVPKPVAPLVPPYLSHAFGPWGVARRV